MATDDDHEEDGSSKTLVLEKDDPLMCEILGAYCNLDRVDDSIFRERGIDIQNSCVRRTMWSLITCLKKLNAFLIREEQIAGIDVESRTRFSEVIELIYPKITFEYAHELETLGLWKWAIFVILHLDNSSQKSKYIRDILLKYAGEELDMIFLRDSLKIPEYYMHEAKATYYQAKGEYAEAFSHWLE